MDLEITEERIDSLKSELESCGKEILSLVTATYSAHPSGGKYDLKQSPQQMLPLLQEEVIDLLKQSQQNAAFFSAHEAKITYCDQLLTLLNNISSIVDKIILCEEALQSLSLIKCAELLNSVQTQLATGSFENILTASNMHRILHKEYRLVRCRLMNKVKRLVYDCIHVESGKVFVLNVLQGYIRSEDKVCDTPVYLADLFSVLQGIKAEDEVIDGLLKEIWQYVVRPLWKEKRVYAPHITISHAHAHAHGPADQKAEFIIGSMTRGVGTDSNQMDNNADSAEGAFTLGTTKLPLSELMDHLGQLFSFLSTQVFISNDAILQRIGDKLFDAPYSLSSQLQELIVHHLPKQIADIPQYQQNLRQVCAQLQDRLATCLRRQNPQPFLLSFVEQLPLTFAQLKRKEILVYARNLLLNDYHNIMVVSSGDASEDEINVNNSSSDAIDSSLCMQKLQFDSCQISINTCKLMKYLHEVMGMVCAHFQEQPQQLQGQSQGQSMAGARGLYDITNVLFHTARDVIELFVAIVPIKFTDVIYSISRMGAVFYNDCIYIIHNLILITHKYKNQLVALHHDAADRSTSSGGVGAGSGIGEEGVSGEIVHAIGFVDFVPRLRKLAEECLTCHLTSLKSKFQAIIANIHIYPEHQPSSTPQLGAINQMQRQANLVYNNESEVYTLLTELMQLTAQWNDILTARIYQKLMGVLLESIVQQLMAPVLAADCVTIVGANEIQRLYRVISGKVNTLLAPSAGGTSATATASGVQALVSAADGKGGAFPCASWRKFVMLADLLDYSLYDIAEALSTHKCSCFTSKEMSRLIVALFEDTPKRQTLLDSIKQVQL